MTTARRPGFEYMALDDFEELLADKPADEKWELIGGRVIRMMVGARWEHKRIVQNITSAMLTTFRAKGSSCRPYDETFWLKEAPLDLAVFPDVMVRCGDLASGAASLSDPTVIVEVLSDGSSRRDRIEKWALYQTLPSLAHYALVSRDEARVEIMDRHDGEWTGLRLLSRADDLLAFPAVDFEMTLIEVYRDVLTFSG